MMLAGGGWRFWVFAVVLPAVALGIVAGSMTVTWLFPEHPAKVAALKVRSSSVLLTEEKAAQFITRASRGNYTEALALAAPDSLDRDTLKARVEAFSPRVTASASLPDGHSLVWVEYVRSGQTLRAHYIVYANESGITGVDGPFAPMNGYRQFEMDLLTEEGYPVARETTQGRGMILVVPRRPDPYLPELLEALRLEAERWGVLFVLGLDTSSPDWRRYARAQGYNGTIWRIKGNVETIPTLASFPFMGTVGLLIDRHGTAVAPFSVLEPARYGREPEEMATILPAVVKAYGLTP